MAVEAKVVLFVYLLIFVYGAFEATYLNFEVKWLLLGFWFTVTTSYGIYKL